MVSISANTWKLPSAQFVMWRVLQHTTNYPIVVTYMTRLQNQLKCYFPKFYSILVVWISNKVPIKHPVVHRSISAKNCEKVMRTTKITIEHILHSGEDMQK